MTSPETTNIQGEPSTPRGTQQQALELILLRQWASYMAMPIWITDTRGMLLYFNEPAERVIGMRYGDAGPMPVSELVSHFEISDEDGNPIHQNELPLAIALRERKARHSRLRINAGDRQFVIAVTAFPIIGQGDRFLGTVAIFWEDEKP